MSDWLERTELLLGEEKLELLKKANVLVVGLGGVGAYAAEMVARSGVGRMTIVDCDTVSLTNINRQLPALTSTVGETKSSLMAARLRDINPLIELTVLCDYLNEENISSVLDAVHYDYVVDAIDTLTPKVMLIEESLKRGLKVVSSMGAGAKTDPTRIQITDISKSNYCPLAHALRKRLNRMGIRKGFMVV
ncbi:MAG: tRNA threonylcarbamoyladenosine dehydratase, partial [Rikenellaceae bacterium]